MPDWEEDHFVKDVQVEFVGGWANALGWDGVSALKKLAKMPRRAKEGFGKLYVAAPLMTR